MNRSPRRPPGIQPLQRGRLAAVSSLGISQPGMTVVRQRPPIASGQTKILRVVEDGACSDPDFFAPWIAFYKNRPDLFKVINHPWKLFVVIAVLMSLSFLIGRLP